MKSRPYVGITGPTSPDEVSDLITAFHDAGYCMETPHIPMLGFLVSHKTLNESLTPNQRYPRIWLLPSLLQEAGPGVLRMIHYNSKETDTLAEQVAKLFRELYDPGLCRALQLNIVWPPVTQVKQIKEQFPEMEIVFQASRRTFEGQSPQEFAKRVKDYRDAINYVLLDPSGGSGQEFDLPRSVALYSELKDQMPQITLGFAGGLTGDNVAEKAARIQKQTRDHDFSIDAEGGLRDKISATYGDDLLNIKKCRHYLKSAFTVMK